MKKEKKSTSHKPLLKFKPKIRMNDIDELVTDQIIQQITEVLPDNDGKFIISYNDYFFTLISCAMQPAYHDKPNILVN